MWKHQRLSSLRTLLWLFLILATSVIVDGYSMAYESKLRRRASVVRFHVGSDQCMAHGESEKAVQRAVYSAIDWTIMMPATKWDPFDRLDKLEFMLRQMDADQDGFLSQTETLKLLLNQGGLPAVFRLCLCLPR